MAHRPDLAAELALYQQRNAHWTQPSQHEVAQLLAAQRSAAFAQQNVAGAFSMNPETLYPGQIAYLPQSYAAPGYSYYDYASE